MKPNSFVLLEASASVKKIFLLYSESESSYSSKSCSSSSFLPETVSSKNCTDSDGLISGLLVVANDRDLKLAIAVGVPTSLLVLIKNSSEN